MRRTQASSLPCELTTDSPKVVRKCVKMAVLSLAAMSDEVLLFFKLQKERMIHFMLRLGSNTVLFNKLVEQNTESKVKIVGLFN